MKDILLTLCVPTNGIIEWVMPVLDSIYDENKPIGMFEVVVTDNGNNQTFKEMMQNYSAQHDNLIYKETKAAQFLNQAEAFKLASGRMIKFVNHRMKLLPGALNNFINYADTYREDRPITYFLNGAMVMPEEKMIYSSFDEYVRGLSYWSSWSAGTAMWKDDFKKLDLSKPFNKLFPHTDFIFAERDKRNYLIDNRRFFEEIPSGAEKKGVYNLFDAFAVEYPLILINLVRTKDISWTTFHKVKEDLEEFLAREYCEFVLEGKKCSYNLTGFEEKANVFFNSGEIKRKAYWKYIKRIIRKRYYNER